MKKMLTKWLPAYGMWMLVVGILATGALYWYAYVGRMSAAEVVDQFREGMSDNGEPGSATSE